MYNANLNNYIARSKNYADDWSLLHHHHLKLRYDRKRRKAGPAGFFYTEKRRSARILALHKMKRENVISLGDLSYRMII